MSREKSLKGNASAVAKMEKILLYRANVAMITSGIHGLFMEANW